MFKNAMVCLVHFSRPRKWQLESIRVGPSNCGSVPMLNCFSNRLNSSVQT